MSKLHKISEKRYLKNPEKWDVWYVAWDEDGKPYAMAKKKKLKDLTKVTK